MYENNYIPFPTKVSKTYIWKCAEKYRQKKNA